MGFEGPEIAVLLFWAAGIAASIHSAKALSTARAVATIALAILVPILGSAIAVAVWITVVSPKSKPSHQTHTK